MGETAISVRGLGKRYQLAGGGPRASYRTLRDALVSAARRPFRRGPAGDPFWALRDVSFEVNRGEVVGVIGRNGAGKSTLLKVLSRITEPTEGEVDIHGRVGSLLEVGTGFHPELTGRENIYLNGAILGMRRAEIARQFDAIVGFAEVERFLDTPVKYYSSGMYTRLAFAVAAHLEPEILIVDEVLAVGDAEFQRKCLGKMRDVAGSGRTVLFVSHDMGAVQRLCGRAVWLAGGRVAAAGPTPETVAAYLAAGAAGAGAVDRAVGPALRVVEAGFDPPTVPADAPASFRVRLTASADVRVDHLCGLVHSPLDVRVGVIDLRSPAGPYRLPAGHSLTVRTGLPRLGLVPGMYRVGLHLVAGEVHDDLPGLSELEVTEAADRPGVPPYPAAARGLVAFDCSPPAAVVSPTVPSPVPAGPP
jgi:ABC-type polysaccharide/polyol phosphate transport system ATPase subunit